jgi:hypothetical protein
MRKRERREIEFVTATFFFMCILFFLYFVATLRDLETDNDPFKQPEQIHIAYGGKMLPYNLV